MKEDGIVIPCGTGAADQNAIAAAITDGAPQGSYRPAVDDAQFVARRPERTDGEIEAAETAAGSVNDHSVSITGFVISNCVVETAACCQRSLRDGELIGGAVQTDLQADAVPTAACSSHEHGIASAHLVIAQDSGHNIYASAIGDDQPIVVAQDADTKRASIIPQGIGPRYPGNI